MKNFFGDLTRHNVAVIAISDSYKCICIFNAGANQDVFVNAIAHIGFTTKIRTQALNASLIWSSTDTLCPERSSMLASVDPTRPHPRITTFTSFLLLINENRSSYVIFSKYCITVMIEFACVLECLSLPG